MKKHLSQELSWQVLFLLGVIGIILGRLLDDGSGVLGAALGVLGVIVFSLGVVNFLASLSKEKKTVKGSQAHK